MAEQFLSILRRTCHFDKRRFAQDIQRFHPRGAQQQQPTSRSHASANTIEEQLNGSSHPQHASKKRKLTSVNEAEAAVDEDEEDGEEEAQGKEEAEEEDDDEDEDDVEVDDDEDEEDDLFAPPPAPTPASSISLFSTSPAPLPTDDSAQGDDEDDSTPSSELRALKLFRKQHSIHVHGTDVPPPMTSFTSLTSPRLPSHLLNNLTASPPHGLGFEDPTPIQMQAIPIMLAGRECVGCSPTGTGKTVAFLLPILLSLISPSSPSSPPTTSHYPGIRSLIIAPTLELASQIHRVCSKLAQGRHLRLLLLSKANSNATTFASPHDVVIATPLRLLHLLQHVPVDVSALHHVVLDEADRLLDLGFLPQVDQILALLRAKEAKRQFLLHLFSATLPHSLDALLPALLFSPIKVVIAHRNTAQPSVHQRLIYTGDERGKVLAFHNMRREGLPVPLLVFVQSSARAQQLHSYLLGDGVVSVAAIHGHLTPHQRAAVIQQFRVGEVSVLITTDLLGRGMDFVSVAGVLNWDFPQSTVSYIHRIGRTGRGGRRGESVTFFTAADRVLLRNVAGVIRWSGGEVPEWMLELHKVTAHKGQQLKEAAPAREPILPSTAEEKKAKEKRRLKAQKRSMKKKAGQSQQLAEATKPQVAKTVRRATGGAAGKSGGAGRKVAAKPGKRRA